MSGENNGAKAVAAVVGLTAMYWGCGKLVQKAAELMPTEGIAARVHEMSPAIERLARHTYENLDTYSAGFGLLLGTAVALSSFRKGSRGYQPAVHR